MPDGSVPVKPNMPEITKTTLPLLTTVLAGFAVLTITALFVESKNYAASSWPPPNQGLFWGLSLLAFSIPFFLISTIFAVWGQAYNNQYLTDEVRKVLRIELQGEALKYYLQELEDKWQIWHLSAVLTFTLGTVAFVTGTAVLLATYVGRITLYIFLGAVGGAVIWWILLRIREGNIAKYYEKQARSAYRGTVVPENVKPQVSVGKEAASPDATNLTTPDQS